MSNTESERIIQQHTSRYGMLKLALNRKVLRPLYIDYLNLRCLFRRAVRRITGKTQ
jgi:hypothetical protein